MTEAELFQKRVETCKQVQNMINELYISKDKIREKIKDIKYRCSVCEFKEILECEKGSNYCGNKIALNNLEDLLKED